MKKSALIIAATVALASSANSPITMATDASPDMATVPFTLEVSAGSLRPMVTASINGHAFPMMVHSNASSLIQLTHREAGEFGVTDIGDKAKQFGIVSPGKLSTLGRSEGRVERLAVGESVSRDVTVDIFEIPQTDRGMLGIPWIQGNRVIVDYAAHKVVVDPTQAYVEAMQRRLVGEGYTAVPMTFDTTEHRYVVTAKVGGTASKMTVASATATGLDLGFADAAHVAKTAPKGRAGGPRGAVIPMYRSVLPVRFELGRWISEPIVGVMIEDDYAYMSQPRPKDPERLNGGTLGSDFLSASRAIVDFGSRTLYVK